MDQIISDVSAFCDVDYIAQDKIDLNILIQLLANYSASLSTKDQNILMAIIKIDNLSIQQESDSLLHKIAPLVWGNVANEKYCDLKKLGSSLWSRPDDQQVLSLLVPKKVWSSIHHLPINLKYNEIYEDKSQNNYDPRFLLPLFASLLSPNCQVSRRKFCEVNGLSYAFMCLSLRDQQLRAVAYTVLFRFRYHLKSLSDEIFQCKSQFLYLLNLVKNSVEKKNQRIPHIVSLFFARTVQILQHANDPLYNVLNGFLLLKPTMELDQIPEFFKLFNSSKHEKYKLERNWILELINDGLREAKDYRILQKRFGLKLLMSYFGSKLSYPESELLIICIIGKVCSIRSACLDMCYNHAFIPWIINAINSSLLPSSNISNLCHHLCSICDCLAMSKNELPPSLKATVLISLNCALRVLKEDSSDKTAVLLQHLKDHQIAFVGNK